MYVSIRIKSRVALTESSFADIKEGFEIIKPDVVGYLFFSHSHIVTFPSLYHFPAIIFTLANFLKHFTLPSLPCLHCMQVLSSLHHFVIL